MAWTLEYDAVARRQLRKLAPDTGQRILSGLERVAATENPRLSGKAMAGKHAGHWRYRFGDYRVIVRLEDDRMIVVVIAIGHRRDVYR